MKILIPVVGGLGNQMFIYAFYQSLLQKGYDANLLWRDYLYTYMHNGIELLELFPNIDEHIGSGVRYALKINPMLNDGMRTFLRKSISLIDRRFKHYRQKTPNSFDILPLDSHKTIILKGFWQNNAYFADYENLIRGKFTFQPNKNENFIKYSQLIEQSNSVSIHIRRGDFLKKVFSDFYVIKDINYYKNSMAFIESRIDKPHYFVFSDDLDWCKSQLGENNITYVEGNSGCNAYLDMQLMSLCKHNIIANSTFSWWGAWLNRNKSKIVCAPQLWTNTGILSESFSPRNWNFIEI